MQYRKITLKEQEYKINGKNELLNRLLSLRGLKTDKEIDAFLNPSKEQLISPFAFCDMEKSVQRIKQAIEVQEKILIWGDFDCDGVTSSSVLYKALKELNANVITFIPDRLLHGHGLNSKELVKFISKEKVKLVITVDCGISNINEVNFLNGFKVDTIITDHHSTDRELPKAFAIINPQVSDALDEKLSVDEITSLSYNSGSVVAYKLAMALLKDSDNQKLKDELLVISSCGAIADVMPILGEIRAMVTIMLGLLNIKKENAQKAIYRLVSKNVQNRDITSTDIAFVLAPRINAVGRLANAKLSFEFLTTEDDSELNTIIEKLDQYNSIRQSLCSETYDEIKEYLKNNKQETDNPAIILMNKEWHVGIIGIVAAKVVEEFGKPCFLMTVDENNNARCSIRSNDIIDVYQVLAQNEDIFSGFGGHKLAGGCSFDLNTTKFEDVKNALIKTINSISKEEKLENVLKADVELNENDLELDLFDTFNQLEPFGEGNQAPICAIFDVELKDLNIIGKEANHTRLNFLKNGKLLNGVCWNENEIQIPKNSTCDIAFYPRINTFNGVTTIQLEIIDIYSTYIEKMKKNSLKSFKLFDHRKKTGIFEQISSYLQNKNLDLKIWAKTLKTKEILSKYENIKNNILTEKEEHDGLMFFDYPSTNEELIEILSDIKPKKIHFMNCRIDENIENYIKQLNGMIKYCSSKLNGNLELEKISQALGVSVEFIQITLEILENLESVEIIDIDKIKYLKPFNYEEFKNNDLFENLKAEFEKILEYKNTLLTCEITEIEKLLENYIN